MSEMDGNRPNKRCIHECMHLCEYVDGCVQWLWIDFSLFFNLWTNRIFSNVEINIKLIQTTTQSSAVTVISQSCDCVFSGRWSGCPMHCFQATTNKIWVFRWLCLCRTKTNVIIETPMVYIFITNTLYFRFLSFKSFRWKTAYAYMAGQTFSIWMHKKSIFEFRYQQQIFFSLTSNTNSLMYCFHPYITNENSMNINVKHRNIQSIYE